MGPWRTAGSCFLLLDHFTHLTTQSKLSEASRQTSPAACCRTAGETSSPCCSPPTTSQANNKSFGVSNINANPKWPKVRTEPKFYFFWRLCAQHEGTSPQTPRECHLPARSKNLFPDSGYNGRVLRSDTHPSRKSAEPRHPAGHRFWFDWVTQVSVASVLAIIGYLKQCCNYCFRHVFIIIIILIALL